MVNKVILLGNLGADPELKTFGETSVAKFSLATSESWKSKEGEKKTETQWHNCEVWGKMAEIISHFAKKGSTLYVEGAVKYDSYEKDNEKKFITKIKVDNFKFIGGGGSVAKAETSHEQEQEPEQEKADLPF